MPICCCSPLGYIYIYYYYYYLNQTNKNLVSLISNHFLYQNIVAVVFAVEVFSQRISNCDRNVGPTLFLTPFLFLFNFV